VIFERILLFWLILLLLFCVGIGVDGVWVWCVGVFGVVG